MKRIKGTQLFLLWHFLKYIHGSILIFQVTFFLYQGLKKHIQFFLSWFSILTLAFYWLNSKRHLVFKWTKFLKEKKVSVEVIISKLKISDVKVLTSLKGLLRSLWVCERSVQYCKGDSYSISVKKKKFSLYFSCVNI